MNMLVPSKKFWIGVLWTTSILSSIRPFRDSSIFDWNIFVVCFVSACKISMEFQIGALFKWRFFSSDDFLKERRAHRKGVLNAITKSSIELEVKQNKKKMRIMKFWSFFYFVGANYPNYRIMSMISQRRKKELNCLSMCFLFALKEIIVGERSFDNLQFYSAYSILFDANKKSARKNTYGGEKTIAADFQTFTSCMRC